MSKKHIHKYQRITMGDNKVWACVLGCGHYMPKHMEMMIPGRKSICWKCGEEFVLDHLNMTRDRPVCCDAGQNAIMEFVEKSEIHSVVGNINSNEKPLTMVERKARFDKMVADAAAYVGPDTEKQ